ncbi:MAG: endospore germination permease [Marinisporobacter sp.]|jgi:spore germination protein KB|nr:endospore germination permease [Marinisporobacter sp.]
MNKEIITDKQGISLIALFIMGSSLVIGIGADAEKDSWIAIIISIFFAFLIFIIYARIFFLFPQKDLFDIINIIFGKTLGIVINSLYIWYAFHLGALVLRNFSEFIKTVALEQTPEVFPMICFMFLCVWGIKEGIEVLGSWAEFTLITFFILICLTIPMQIPNMQLNHILPMLSKGFDPVLKGAFAVFSFPFAETILFGFIFSGVRKKKSPYKIYLVGLVIGGLFIFITALDELLVLGAHAYTTTYFPAHSAVSRMNIGDFIQRSEIIVAIGFLGAGFIKICICLLVVCKGITKLFGFSDYRFSILPISLLMLNLSILIYEDILEMVDWAFHIYNYYAFPFQVLFPVIILAGAEIKRRNRI